MLLVIICFLIGENGVTRKCVVVEFVFGQIELDGRKVFLLRRRLIERIIAFVQVRGENLPISLVSEKDERRPLIVTYADEMLDVACFQLHLHCTPSKVCRTDHQDQRIVRHLSDRRDHSRMFRDLRARPQRVRRRRVAFVAVVRRCGQRHFHIDRSDQKHFLDVLRVENPVEVLPVNKRPEEKFQSTREIRRHTTGEPSRMPLLFVSVLD